MPRTTETAKTADVAFVTPSVVTWAIENSPLTRAEIAKKLKLSPDQLRSWERGVHPPFGKAEALSKALGVPFGYLFLSEPPQVDLPLPDFRAKGHRVRPSTEFLQLLNDVLVKQDWYRDYLNESMRPAKLKFVGSFDHKSSVSAVATDIRKTLEITAALRTGIGSHSDYLSTLARHAEGVGILVMRSSIVGNVTRRSLPLDEVQGFAIADELAPVVFINSADYKAAQIFTMAHELAHIWIGQSAITTPDQVSPGTNAVEAFCNRVAAAVLVPRSEFIGAWKSLSANEPRLNMLAKRFWVSTLVVLRRAHELELISDAEFARLLREERRAVTKGAKPSGGDFYRNVFVRMGARFTYTVLGEVNRNSLLLRDGARLLGVSVPTLVKFAEQVK